MQCMQVFLRAWAVAISQGLGFRGLEVGTRLPATQLGRPQQFTTCWRAGLSELYDMKA